MVFLPVARLAGKPFFLVATNIYLNHQITILVRTSNRPLLFQRCIKSVENQTYKNVRIIVGFDSEEAAEYTADYESYYMTKKSVPYFYNEYCNELKDRVEDGFFFFLDDDDYLDHPKVLEELSKELTSEAVICQYRRKGFPKPPKVQMDKGELIKGYVGLPCLVLHSKHKSVADVQGLNEWDDWLWIKQVCEVVKPNFLKMVLVNSEKRNYGKAILHG